MGGKKEIYRDVQFFHGALQLLFSNFSFCQIWPTGDHADVHVALMEKSLPTSALCR